MSYLGLAALVIAALILPLCIYAAAMHYIAFIRRNQHRDLHRHLWK